LPPGFFLGRAEEETKPLAAFILSAPEALSPARNRITGFNGPAVLTFKHHAARFPGGSVGDMGYPAATGLAPGPFQFQRPESANGTRLKPAHEEFVGSLKFSEGGIRSRTGRKGTQCQAREKKNKLRLRPGTHPCGWNSWSQPAPAIELLPPTLDSGLLRAL